MKDEITNRVAQSALITLDLESEYPKEEKILFDIKDWLEKDFILKEKEFRQLAKNHNWKQYKNKFIALFCSSDAILPSWTFLLLTTYLTPFVKKIVQGNLEDLDNTIFLDIVKKLPLENFKNRSIIIAGCSKKKIPNNVFVQLIQKLQPVAKSIFYGEACSSVPLFKRKI